MINHLLIFLLFALKELLDKVILLHEEIPKPIEEIRTDRLTRNFYNLDKIINLEYEELTLADC